MRGGDAGAAGMHDRTRLLVPCHRRSAARRRAARAAVDRSPSPSDRRHRLDRAPPRQALRRGIWLGRIRGAGCRNPRRLRQEFRRGRDRAGSPNGRRQRRFGVSGSCRRRGREAAPPDVEAEARGLGIGSGSSRNAWPCPRLRLREADAVDQRHPGRRPRIYERPASNWFRRSATTVSARS